MAENDKANLEALTKAKAAAEAARPALAAKATDLEALRTAVTDAATVGGTLWLSYLFALFYLLVAAGGVNIANGNSGRRSWVRKAGCDA